MTKTSLLFLLLLCTLPGFAQQKTAGRDDAVTTLFTKSEASHNQFLDSLYTVRTGTSIAHINGYEYYPYHYRAKNKPMLFYGKDRTSSITVSGRKYDNIILQYDSYTDEIVFSEMENGFGSKIYQIAINKDIVGSFTLYFRDDTLTFKYFDGTESSYGLPPGFYETAYDGNSTYLIRHRSVAHERNGINEYFYSPAGYVRTSAGYQRITSTSKFIKLFGAGSAEMKRILDQRNQNIRKAGKRNIINILRTYDNLQGVTQER